MAGRGMQHHQPGLPSNYMHTGRDMPTSPAAVMATLRSAQAKGPSSPLLPTHSNAADSASAGVSLSLASSLCSTLALAALMQKLHFQAEAVKERDSWPSEIRGLPTGALSDNAYSHAPHC